MKELGFNVVIEEGVTGQFELFKKNEIQRTKDRFPGPLVTWDSFMKEGSGIPKFFTLHDVELKLSGHSTTEK